MAALSPRLPQPLLLAAAVGAFLGLGAIWLWRFRRGQPMDIDEAGYLSIAILDYRGLVDGGPGGYWDAVMAPGIQAPLMTALTGLVFVVTGTGILPGLLVPLFLGGVMLLAGYGLGHEVGGPRVGWLTLALAAGTPVVIGYSRSYNFAIASGRGDRGDAVGDRALPHLRPGRLVGRCGRRHRAGGPLADHDPGVPAGSRGRGAGGTRRRPEA